MVANISDNNTIKKSEKESEVNVMDMCYDVTLVLPSSYAVMEEEEMSYVEGGALSKVDKALIIGICAASAITLTVALVYGQLALAAKILRWSVKKVARKAGAAAVVGCITATLGISGTAVWAVVNFIL